MSVEHSSITQKGRDAYYDKLPRYKNPYVGKGSAEKWWYEGWNDACQNHTLFVENMGLKERKRELQDKISSLEATVNKLVSSITRDSQLICSYEKMLSDVSSLLDEAFFYVDGKGVFSFRREKMKSYLEKLRVRVKKTEMESSRGVKKES